MAANNKLIILLLLVCLLPHIIFTSASAKYLDTKADVDSLCRATPYPNQCVSSLTPYVQSRAIESPKELVLLLLKDALYLATNTTAFLLKEITNLPTQTRPQVFMLVDYCFNLLRKVSDSLNVTKSMLTSGGEGGVGAKNGNNLERWTSAALTDAETLVSKFQGRRLSKLESTIYEKVKNVEETTSNALAILQHYSAARH